MTTGSLRCKHCGKQCYVLYEGGLCTKCWKSRPTEPPDHDKIEVRQMDETIALRKEVQQYIEDHYMANKDFAEFAGVNEWRFNRWLRGNTGPKGQMTINPIIRDALDGVERAENYGPFEI